MSRYPLTLLALALASSLPALAQPTTLEKLEVDPRLLGPRPQKPAVPEPPIPSPTPSEEGLTRPSEPKSSPEPAAREVEPAAPPQPAEAEPSAPESQTELPLAPEPPPERTSISDLEEAAEPVVLPDTIQLHAGEVRGRGQNELEAEGDVVLQQGDKVLFADWLAYNKPQDEVLARGKVSVKQPGAIVDGSRVQFRIAEETGFVEDPRLLARPDSRASGDTLFFEGPNKYRLTNASYTTCEVGEDDWYFRARELRIDRDRQVAVARDATVEFQGVPILYTPFIDFPLNNQRKSGLLSPTFGTSNSNGIELIVPYYFNIAPNLDATIAPRLLTRRGLLLNNELRYLQPQYSGEARVEVLPSDRIEGRSRWAYNLRHNHDFRRGWSGYLNALRASDDDYFRDLSNEISATSRTNLPQEGGLVYSATWGSLLSRVQRFQTLEDPRAPVVAPYERVPQLLLNSLKPGVLGADWSALGEFVDFRHPELVTGARLLLYPNVSYPLQTSYAYLTPKIGVHHTRYSLDTRTAPDESRTLPIFSLDSGLIFERETGFFGQRFLQTLEPRAYYVYIPFEDQSQIPVFDTALADFNLSQIFSENQFVGGDRVNDANQVTVGVTSRLLEPATGRERLRATVAQRYHFDSQRVTLPAVLPRTSNSSDLLAALSTTVAPFTTIDAGVQYNTDLPETSKTSFGVRYAPAPGKLANFTYRFTRDVLEQVDVSGQWPFSARWAGLGRYNYSLREERLLEALAGVEYNDGCWAIRLVAHRFVTATQEVSNSIFVQLELGGIARIGSDPTSTLKQNISGYRRVSPAAEVDEPVPGDL